MAGTKALTDIRTGDIVREIVDAADGRTILRIDQIHVSNISVATALIRKGGVSLVSRISELRTPNS